MVDITNLRGSPKQEKLHRIIKQKRISESRSDAFYAAGVNRVYEEIIIPALEEGKIIIVDRSEIDLLCYAVEHSEEATIEKRKKYIEDGTITHRLWAGNRIFLDADPKETRENLRNREHKSPYDPASLEEMEISSKAQQVAERYIESLPHLGETKIIREKVNRIENETEREKYLNLLTEKLLGNLDLSERKNGGE